MSGDPPQPSDSHDLVLTEADQGRELEAASGDVITVRLRENPTTGFRWTQVDQPGTSLVLQSDEFSVGGTAPGAGGERVLQYRAVAPGRGEIDLALRREWEAPEKAQRRVGFWVKVH
jgi:inhibitor of cysteine peptidase